MREPRRPLIVEGICTLAETDSGFLPCHVGVGEESLDMLLARHVDVAGPAEDDGGRPYGLRDGTTVEIGLVRITVEFL